MNINELLELINEKAYKQIRTRLVDLQEADIAELIEELEDRDALIVYRLLPKEIAADVFAFLDIETQSEISMLISEKELAYIINELNFDDKIDLLEEMPANVVKMILRDASDKERKLINQFLNYKEASAGSLMTIEFVDLRADMTVENAMSRIRRIGITKETIYTCFVTDNTRRLEGIVTLKELVLSPQEHLVGEIMETEVISVSTTDDQEVIANIFKKYDFLSLPVVDHENRLVGIITIDDVVDVIEEETTEDFQKMAAIEPSDMEYMSMTSFELAKRRLMWLVILMFSATITEYISNENTYLTAQFAILFGVIPMLMSTGGNAGAQSSTLVIRGITLGEIDFNDFLAVIWKEIKVGLYIGGTLGGLNFTRILLLRQDLKLASIVGLTLIGTSVTATTVGGMLPILAKKLKLDPATMANPLITTITDALTLIIFFAISAIILL
ncbi:Magnesium transporter MgtE [Petrocella atlantisensis]|uniref:Magnesium transporter MgtE n=1 Tax=Petrocella atlantisensis TaxID=2173034 RepID=A0A3P7NVF7_9FIRM|nr:Magnesium transporter MgtE [Petrocella atlantisensis]